MSYTGLTRRRPPRRPLQGLGQTPPAASPWDAIVPPECTTMPRSAILPDQAENAGEVALVLWPMVKWTSVAGSDPMRTWIEMITTPMSVNDHLFNGAYGSRNPGGTATQPTWFPAAPNRMGTPCGTTTVNYGNAHGVACGGLPRGQLPPIGYMPLAPIRAWQDLMPADPANADNASPWPPPPLPWTRRNPGRWNSRYAYGAQRIIEQTGADPGGSFGPIAIGPMMAGFIPRPGNDQSVAMGVAWIAVPLRQNVDGSALANFIKSGGVYAFRAVQIDYHSIALATKLTSVTYWSTAVPADLKASAVQAVIANGRTLANLSSLFMGTYERSWGGTLYNTGAADPIPATLVTDFYSQFDANALYTGISDPTLPDATGFRAPSHTDRARALSAWLTAAVEAQARTAETAVAITGAVLTSFFGSSAVLVQSAAGDAAGITNTLNSARSWMAEFGHLSTDLTTARQTIASIVAAATASIATAMDAASVDSITSQALSQLSTLRSTLGSKLSTMQSDFYANPSAPSRLLSDAGAAKAKYTPEYIVASVASEAGRNAITQVKFQVAKDVFKCIILGMAKDGAAHTFDAFLAAIAAVPQIASDVRAAQAQIPQASAAVTSVLGQIDVAKNTITDARSKREDELGLSWFMKHHAGLPTYAWLGIGGAATITGLVVLRKIVKSHRAPTANRRRSRARARRLHA